MHWYLTIPFLLGIMLSREVEVAWWWQLAVLLLGVVLMWGVFRRRGNPVLLILLNSFLLGALYCSVRSLGDEASYPSDSMQVGSSYQKTAHSPSSGVLQLEEYLSHTQMSETHCKVLNAMLLGDRSHLDGEQKQVYRQAGAQHLLALSGMHLGILLALLSVLFLPRVRFSRWRWPVLVCVLLLMWGYALMVGMPKSLLRAVLMSSLFLLAKFSLRPTRGYEILATVVLVMLVIDPLCAFDIGAQLSVVALVGLTCFYPALDGVLPFVREDLVGMTPFLLRHLRSLSRFVFVSLSAWMFTMPLVLYYFHQFQPWQPVVSIVLIPITSLVLYGAVFVWVFCWVGCFCVANVLSVALDGLMDVQDVALYLSGSLPYASVEVPNVSLWHVILLYALFAELWVALRYRTLKVQMLALGGGISTILLFAVV